MFAFDSAEDLDDEVIICSTSFGLRLIRPVISRLPLTVDIGGFGIMPQMFLATDGPLSPPEGEILISSRLSLLNASQKSDQWIDTMGVWGIRSPHITN